jgi:nucleoside-diphosphate-sugar epimerase
VVDERNAVAVMAEAMSGPSTEESPVASFNPRAGIETLAKDLVDDGANIAIVRLSQIHDARKQGFTSYLLAHAREKGVAAYVGDGERRWAAAHVTDTARLYRLAFERADPGAVYHAVAEEGVKLRAIAEAHANGLGVPLRSITLEEAEVHFGWVAPFATLDLPSSSALTQQRLDWRPTGPGPLADLVRMDYRSV